MVALLGLREHLEVGVLGFRRLPRGAVDALEVGVVLIAAPVRSRAPGELERGDVLGCRDVRAAAQIAPDHLAGAGIQVVVRGEFRPTDLHDFAVVGRALVVDQLELVRLLGELHPGLVLRRVDPSRELLTRLDDLLHLLLERGEIFGGEGLGDVEVVVEAVLDRRPDPELCLGKEILHGLCEHVRRRMPDHAPARLGVGGNRFDVGVEIGSPGEIAQLACGITNDDDGLGSLVGQFVLAQRRARGGPGRHTDRGWAGHHCVVGHFAAP